ncbi:HAD family hydrolase [Candidatus Enterococcus mansonii]|uniref:Uncharacterized protein n=1 Tax=Candidatus Enterococcus mansonii TaxID=1834181 RepID=A0A242CDE2_9ENTE|nr:HAD family hydrolase [Enterococcus sp. 4G2_DIV0659]OTO08226.1 hypothetical protein A5880_002496 [Enterococcus sp. 4G2_DIV0659]
MLYKTILFDLDGTVTDSAEGIINSVSYALEKMNIQVPERTQLYSFIGPPLNDSFKQFYQLNDASAKQAVNYYRDYYQEKGMYENKVYQNIPEVLGMLKKAGCKLYIATSKPEMYAIKILTHFALANYFDGIYGASLDGNRSKKGEIICYALEKAKITNRQETIMIGDRRHDILGAKENGLASMGVLYGFGAISELKDAGATYIVEKPADIVATIIKRKEDETKVFNSERNLQL